MLYQRRAFTVPATGKTIISCEQGHAMLDQRRNCIRCGEHVPETPLGQRRVGHAPHVAHHIDLLAKP